MLGRKIDHIVYCVPHLEEAIEDLEYKLGVKASIGGKHLTQGTQNALIHLGQGMYLEILAIDQNNTQVVAPRWMGIDFLQSSKITRWALKSQDIMVDGKLLSDYNPEMGFVTGGSRKMVTGKMLHWQIAMPLSTPEVDIVPFITDWSKSEAHPTDTLDHPCQLLELRLNHPNPTEIQNLFDKMGIVIHIHKAHYTSIQASIQCPKGVIQL